MLTGSIALSLIQNTAILLSFSMLYDYIWVKEESKHFFEKALAGLVVGGIGLVLMFTPWTFSTGLIFDTRSILLCISGLFLGPIPTVVAMVITGICRILIGGDGVFMGLSVIVASGLTGIIWYRYRPNWKVANHLLELTAMACVVHILMLLFTFLLPHKHFLDTVKIIIFPILTIYIPGTVLLGLLMHKRAENWKNKKALRETKALYASLVENMPAGVFRKSLDGRFDYVNSRFCSLKGLSPSEVLGKTPMELAEYETTKKLAGQYQVIPRQKTLGKEGMEHHDWIVKNRKSMEVEESFEQADGTVEYFQVVKTPIFDDDGQVVGSQGMQFDVTLQKRLQEELTQAKEKAEDSDRLKTAFLHNISHEIRTPMNAIVGFSNLLRDQDLPLDGKMSYIDVICQSSDQLLTIIDDLVRIATIEAGLENVSRVELHLNALNELIYKQFLSRAEKKGIELLVENGLSDPDDLIVSDEIKIQEVISNLLDNALKFTEKGHVRFGYQQKGDALEFFVEDTGIGIPQEFQDDIFIRFRQADSSLNREYGGSGLGLSICKAYIELLGGHMWVESQHGVGSVFFFTLPYKASQSVKETDYSGISDKSFTILVAEDEDLNFILLKEILSQITDTVLRARNGEEVVQMALNDKDIKLILMDLKMPALDGYEATRQIKAVFPDLPILALTAYSNDSDKDKAFECGCSDFISKPYNKAGLIAKLQKYL